MSALQLAQVLAAADHRDLRLQANDPLRRALPEDPEMSWQSMRRLGHAAEDWIATDTLADLWARGILAEDFRWAELEQLLYSLRTYERRLVPATLASLPHRLPGARRDSLRPRAVERALELAPESALAHGLYGGLLAAERRFSRLSTSFLRFLGSMTGRPCSSSVSLCAARRLMA